MMNGDDIPCIENWQCGSYGRQLKAVLRKTWILKIRDSRTLLTEIMAPLSLIFLLLWGFSMSEVCEKKLVKHRLL